jgi:hypothetical protein
VGALAAAQINAVKLLGELLTSRTRIRTLQQQ